MAPSSEEESRALADLLGVLPQDTGDVERQVLNEVGVASPPSLPSTHL